MFIKKFLLAVSIGLLSCGMTFADDKETAEVQAVSDISKAITQINKPDSSVWPGFQIAEPVGIVFPSGDTYAFNKYQPWAKSFYQIFSTNSYYYGWSKKATIDNVDYYFGNVEKGNHLEFRDFKVHESVVEDQKILGYGFPDSFYSGETTSSQFIYHSFKRYERHNSIGFKSYLAEKKQSAALKQASVAYADLYEQTNIELMYLELKALEDYATHNNTQALKYYAAINQVRLSALNKDSQTYEKNDELLSGTASYVSWKAEGQLEQDYFSAHLAKYAIPEVTVPITYTYATYLPRYLSPISEFSKHFNRHTTPLVGSGLDKLYRDKGLDPNQWKKEVETNHIPASIALQNFYNLNLDDAKVLVAEAKNLYGFDQQIAPKLAKILGCYKELMQKELENYHNQPGIEVVISLPQGAHSYEGGLSLPVDNQTTMEINSTGELFHASPQGTPNPIGDYTRIPYIFITHTFVHHQLYLTFKFKIQSSDLLDIGELKGKKAGDLSTSALTPFEGTFSLNNEHISMNSSGFTGEFEGSNGQLNIAVSKVESYSRGRRIYISI